LIAKHGLRGGGHNVAGNAVCDDGLVIDLSGMTAIQVDAPGRTVRAQPGVVRLPLGRGGRPAAPVPNSLTPWDLPR